MRSVERLAGGMLRGMTTPHLIPSTPAPQPADVPPAQTPVEWFDTVPAARWPGDESEACDA